MVDKEIYYLTKHGNFQSEYIENIPIYKRRHFIYLLNEEIEKENEEIEKIKRKNR
jgi:hypothetical protein